MKIIRNSILLGLALTASTSFAQQTQLSSLFPYNRILVNPAEAGYNNVTDVSLSFRKQWTGIAGTPTTSWLSGHTALNEKMGLGGVVIYDEMAFIKNIDAKLSYAYHLKLAKDFKLSFGIGAGVQQSTISTSGVLADDYTDEILVSGNTSGILFDAQFGTLITYKEFRLGINTPQLLQPRMEVPTPSFETNYDLRSHLNVYLAYDSKINESVRLIPTVFYRRSNASSQFDVFGNVEFNKTLMLGLGYREGVGVLANVGAKIKNKFQINYAYDFGKAGYGSNSGGSHEIMLKLLIEKKEKEQLIDDGEKNDDKSESIKNKF
jgi:type IX secretion system PorP/SprF family membrane protein